MRLKLLRRIVASVVALAFVVALGLEGVRAAAMAGMTNDMSMAMTTDAPPGMCPPCDASGKNAAMQCQPVCAPSLAVLPTIGTGPRAMLLEFFEAPNFNLIGRTGTPEPHPPKAAALF